MQTFCDFIARIFHKQRQNVYDEGLKTSSSRGFEFPVCFHSGTAFP